MTDTIKYKQYTASVSFSTEDGVFYGKILDIKGLILFEGKSDEELMKAFEEAIEDYLGPVQAS